MDENYSNGSPQKPVLVNQIPNNDSRMAVASLVLGILSLVSCWTCFIPVISGIVALVLGIISLSKKREGTGMATAGIIMGAVGILLGIVAAVIYLLYISAA